MGSGDHFSPKQIKQLSHLIKDINAESKWEQRKINVEAGVAVTLGFVFLDWLKGTIIEWTKDPHPYWPDLPIIPPDFPILPPPGPEPPNPNPAEPGGPGGGGDDWDGGKGAGYAMSLPDPLVLDLNGNVFQTTSVWGGAFFDTDANGLSHLTGWIDPHDGVLVMDRNGDGIINDGTELFGDQTILKDGRKASNGSQAFAELDTKKDGKIDAQDAAFTMLRVWTDEIKQRRWGVLRSSARLWRAGSANTELVRSGVFLLNRVSQTSEVSHEMRTT